MRFEIPFYNTSRYCALVSYSPFSYHIFTIFLYFVYTKIFPLVSQLKFVLFLLLHSISDAINVAAYSCLFIPWGRLPKCSWKVGLKMFITGKVWPSITFSFCFSLLFYLSFTANHRLCLQTVWTCVWGLLQLIWLCFWQPIFFISNDEVTCSSHGICTAGIYVLVLCVPPIETEDFVCWCPGRRCLDTILKMLGREDSTCKGHWAYIKEKQVFMEKFTDQDFIQDFELGGVGKRMVAGW